MKISFMIKAAIFLIAFMIVFGGINVLTPPKKAEAVWGVEDVVFDPQAFAKAVADWEMQIAQWLKEEAVKALRDAVVKRLLDYMTDQTIAWINGGGTPQFISDWQGFLRQATNAAVGDVVLQTNAAFLCSPFKYQVSLALLPVPKYTQSISCTFDKIVGNLDAFYNDFKKGSWLGYTTAWSPENNYYGTLIRAHDEITERTAAAQTAAQSQGIADKGYLPVKTCSQWDYSASESTCGDVYASCVSGGSAPEECEQLSEQCFDQNKTCSSRETTSPGDVVGTALRAAINSDSQWAANVQSAISAITNALINKLITKGLIYAVGSANQVSYSGGEYTEKYQGTLSRISNLSKQQMTKEMEAAVTEWQYLLGKKTLSLSNASSTLESLQKSSLDSCDIGDDKELPPLTTDDISKAQADVDRLKMETDVLRGEINDVSVMIDKMKKADLSDINQMSDVQADFMRFVDNYDTETAIATRNTGENRRAADIEKANMQSSAEEAAQRALHCPLRSTSIQI